MQVQPSMRQFSLVLCLLAGMAALPALAFEDTTVYTDALAPGFQDWSWGDVDFANTAPVHGGSHSVRFTAGAWQGLTIHSEEDFEFKEFTGLRFWVHGGTSGGQALRLEVSFDGEAVIAGDLADFVSGGVAAGEWREAWVPFHPAADVNALFNGVTLWAAYGTAQPAIYLDDIQLIGREVSPEAVSVSVDRAGPKRAISPYIYGVNFGTTAQLASLRYPFRRWGGNHTSRYNFASDSDNRAADWFFLNTPQGNGSNLPANSTANQFIDATRMYGAETLLTIPTLGWIALDERVKAWSFSIAKYGPQHENECSYYGANPPSWCEPDAGDGTCDSGQNCSDHLIVGNDPEDASKPVGTENTTAWVQHLVNRHGSAAAGGVRYYALDNEAMLWNDTHRDVHPLGATYDEVWQRGRDHALAIKAADPDAVLFGPVTWGWCDYWSSAADAELGDCMDGADRQAHGGMGFVDWYLEQSCANLGADGRPLVDVLDLHYYPQRSNIASIGNNVALGEQRGVRTTRLRSLRELHDPAWRSESWVGETAEPVVNLIPRARAAIAQRCPAMKLALTEYKWGPDNGQTGAIAQAELLAIFGREGLDYATRWVAPEPGSLAEAAFRMFLDWDGAQGRILGDSIPVTTSNHYLITAYAVEGAGGRLFVLLFNHSRLAQPVTIAVDAADGPVRRFRLDGAGYAEIPGGTTVAGGTIALGNLPSYTAELLVVEPAAGDLIFRNGFETSAPAP